MTKEQGYPEPTPISPEAERGHYVIFDQTQWARKSVRRHRAYRFIALLMLDIARNDTTLCRSRRPYHKRSPKLVTYAIGVLVWAIIFGIGVQGRSEVFD